MVVVFFPMSTCQPIKIEILPNNFILNLDASVVLNLSKSEAEFGV